VVRAYLVVRANGMGVGEKGAGPTGQAEWLVGYINID